jgi:hypothetical protein
VAEIDLTDLLTGLVEDSDEARTKLEAILQERKEMGHTIADLEERVTDAVQANDSLETVLAGVKRRLREARHDAASLQQQVNRLQRQAQSGSTQSNPHDDFIRRLLGEQLGTDGDPHGHCAAIGLDPAFLFELNPDAAVRMVKGAQRALAMEFHSDRHGGDADDEPLKRVNIAVDSVLNRIEQGYWGRH